MGIGKRRGKIHVVFQDSGVGGARDGEGHLVGNRKEGVFEQLEGNRVLNGCHDFVSLYCRRFSLESFYFLHHCPIFTFWGQSDSDKDNCHYSINLTPAARAACFNSMSRVARGRLSRSANAR
jgi:hypothetical protein